MPDRLIISEDGMTAVLDETIQLEAEVCNGRCAGCFFNILPSGCRDLKDKLTTTPAGARCTPGNRPDHKYIIWKVKES